MSTSLLQLSTDAGKEYIIEEGVISEVAWQEWQAFHDVRRRETFLRILEAQGKHLVPYFSVWLVILSIGGFILVHNLNFNSLPSVADKVRLHFPPDH